MKIVLLIIFLVVFVVVDCGHTFLGTNLEKHMVYHHNAQFSSRVFRKRVENIYFSMPQVQSNIGKTIQGVLAYDLTHSGASANVTQGGIGYPFINLRLKSDRGKELNYDIYVYA